MGKAFIFTYYDLFFLPSLPQKITIVSVFFLFIKKRTYITLTIFIKFIFISFLNFWTKNLPFAANDYKIELLIALSLFCIFIYYLLNHEYQGNFFKSHSVDSGDKTEDFYREEQHHDKIDALDLSATLILIYCSLKLNTF